MVNVVSVLAYRPPTEEDKAHLAALQAGWLAMEILINEHVPAGRERALAITRLQECRMWSNAGLLLSKPE